MNRNDSAPEEKRRRLRRVIIEDPQLRIENRQRKTLEHVRDHLGYDADVDPNAYNKATFRLINQRKQLDRLSDAEYVVPALDEWKHWTKMNDWDSRNRLVEQLIDKLRRREATSGEVTLLITVCRPAWAAVTANLRTYGGVQTDSRADGRHRQEESWRTMELDRSELDDVVRHALLNALIACPRPFPRRFFPWLKETLAYRALEHVREELVEVSYLPHDSAIKEVLDGVLSGQAHQATSLHATPGAPGHSVWLRTLDLPAMFELAEEYATYNRTQSACERAVNRLPDRQRSVIRDRYYREMTQVEIAKEHGLAASSVRNSHGQGIGNLRRDDELFEVLAAVGKVRDRDRRLKLEAERKAA